MRTILTILAVASVSANTAQPVSANVAVAPALTGELQSSIVEGPWSARRPATNGCPKLYILMSRTCPFSQALMREQLTSLDRAGYDLRLHVVPVAGEPAGALAEVALRRDPRLTMNYLRGARVNGAEPSDRTDGGLEAFNAMVTSSSTFRKISRQARFTAFTPSIVWQDRRGQWRILSGYAASMMPELLASLRLPAPGCAE
jgi:hypothetical protein